MRLYNGVHTAIIRNITADRPLTHDTLNAPLLLTNRQFQWTGNGHSQLPLVELGKPSPNIDHAPPVPTTGSNRSINNFHCLTLTFDLRSWPTIPGYPRSRSILMPKIKVKGPTIQTGERPQTNGRTDTHTHTRGCYQTYYLP